MGIWDRLGNVIKSYLNDNDSEVFRKSTHRSSSDPDLDAAYEELNNFLGGKDGGKKSSDYDDERKTGSGFAGERKRPMSDELKKDFAELGLSPDATAEECKAAYKKLLKLHHPDRHAGHEGNLKKATEKASRVNAAYDRLVKWFQNSS